MQTHYQIKSQAKSPNVQYHLRSPAKAFCKRDWRRSSRFLAACIRQSRALRMCGQLGSLYLPLKTEEPDWDKGVERQAFSMALTVALVIPEVMANWSWFILSAFRRSRIARPSVSGVVTSIILPTIVEIL